MYLWSIELIVGYRFFSQTKYSTYEVIQSKSNACSVGIVVVQTFDDFICCVASVGNAFASTNITRRKF